MKLLFSMLLTGLILTSLGCGPRNGSAIYNKRDYETYRKWGVEKVKSGDYEGAKKAFSEAIRLNPNFAVPYKIFDGEEAIRELKNLGYKIHKTNGGYRLTKTKMETIPGSWVTSNRVVTTEREVIVGEYAVELMRGAQYDLLEQDMSWSVDRNGKIWIAVLNRIVVGGRLKKKEITIIK